MISMLKTVLLTDDRSDFVAKLSAAIRTSGMDVISCPKDGTEVLKLLEERNPDVVIMDSFMQHLDAVGVVSRINMTDPAKRPLIIVLSTISNQGFEREMINCGIDYCFIKPVDPIMVSQRLLQLLTWKEVGIGATYNPPEDLDVTITNMMLEIGIPAHVSGYKYVRHAIKMAVESPDMLNSVTKVLYPGVAKYFKSTPSRVERAIRHAIEIGWDRGDIDVINSYFGYTIQSQRGKPTNSEFIAMMADKIRLKRKNLG